MQKSLFAPAKLSATPVTNRAGGAAYDLGAKEALAQLAVTGTFNNTFYTSGVDQMARIKELTGKVEPAFLAKLAVYSRRRGFMKDMPIFLLGLVSGQAAQTKKLQVEAHQIKDMGTAARRQLEGAQLAAMIAEALPHVVDNGKMLRNYIEMIRSGQAGRTSLGATSKRLLRAWFDSKSDKDIFYNSVGSDPSLADVIKLVRPIPTTRSRAALYAYFLEKKTCRLGDETFSVADALPECVKEFEAFKKDKTLPLPQAPYELLEGLGLSPSLWKDLARQASWDQTRQHLNTFMKHEVFFKEEKGKRVWDRELIEAVAKKLKDPELIKRAKAMPYKLLNTYAHMGPEMPVQITQALHDAMEVATENVPVIEGTVAVFVDISQSMRHALVGVRLNPKTGKEERHSSNVSSIDVAALVTASILRTNPRTVVIPFSDDALIDVVLNPKDPVLVNAKKLISLPSQGTNCSAPLVALNEREIAPDLCIYVSDNESWVDSPSYGCHSSGRGLATRTHQEWAKLKARNPNAKLVCLDIQPGATTQAPSRSDTLNVGGFSDAVFDVISQFWQGTSQNWVSVIENVLE